MLTKTVRARSRRGPSVPSFFGTTYSAFLPGQPSLLVLACLAPHASLGYPSIGDAFILTQLAYHGAASVPLLFEGGFGSPYTDGANGKSVHRQVIETYLLMFEAVAEVGIEEGFKA